MPTETHVTDQELLSGSGAGLIDRLMAWSMRNKALVLVALLLWVAGGIYAAQQLSLDAVPDVTNVQVQILTTSPGLSPTEVERRVTMPIERSMAGLPDTTELRSISRYGLSVVTVVFEDGTDLWFARQQVSERLPAAQRDIPEHFGTPEIGPPSTGLGEIFQFEIRAQPGYEDQLSLMDLRDVLEWQVAPALRATSGVVEVNAFGGALRTYQIEISPSALASRGLTLSQVFEALEQNNLSVGGGSIERGREQVLVRGSALLGSLEDVASVGVSTSSLGTPVTIGSLGTVSYAPMIRQGAVTRDGRGEAVIGIAMMGYEQNARVVSADLAQAVEELQPSLPEGVAIEVFYDRSDLVARTISTVQTNLVEGGILVIAVLLLLLGNLRGGLLVALAIPLSMGFAFGGMVVFGVSGNLMSLGAIDFGLIVDGSVVMIENVVRVVSGKRARGEPVDDATILGACREVARPVVFSVAIITLVYLPVLGLSGVEGRMFRPMALTVVFALLGSLVLAVMAMPVLASLVLKGSDEKHTWLMRLLNRGYPPMLERFLSSPRLSLGLAFGLFGLSLALIPQLGAEFAPKLSEGSIAVQIIRPPSVSLSESLAQATAVEQALLARFPDEVDTVISRTGTAEIATDPMGVDFSDVYVMLQPREAWTQASSQAELVELMDASLSADVPGVNFAFSQPIELRVNELLEGVRSDVALFLYGEDLAQLELAGQAVVASFSQVAGVRDLKAQRLAGLPMLSVEVDPVAISRLGMDAQDVLDAVQVIGGRPVGEVMVGQRRFGLQVRYPEPLRADPESLAGVLVGAPGGVQVPLGHLAELREEAGPVQIGRSRGQRRLTIEMNVRGRDVAGFVAQAKERLLTDGVVPRGVATQWGGNSERLAQASARLGVLLPLVLLLIFVLLQANFGQVRVTLLVYANVPMALSGGLLALWVRGLPLSISAAVGFIALFGVAVMNGVVLLTCVRGHHQGTTSALEAARLGAQERLRPVLMTALVAGLGFLPMALSSGAGAELQRPLATVVIGGLVSCTVLTLCVLPSAYGWLMTQVDGLQAESAG